MLGDDARARAVEAGDPHAGAAIAIEAHARERAGRHVADVETAVSEERHGARVGVREGDGLCDGAGLDVDDDDGGVAGEDDGDQPVCDLDEAEGLGPDGDRPCAGEVFEVDDVEATAVARGDRGAAVRQLNDVRGRIRERDRPRDLPGRPVEHDQLVAVLIGEEDAAAVARDGEGARDRAAAGLDRAWRLLAGERFGNEDKEGDGADAVVHGWQCPFAADVTSCPQRRGSVRCFRVAFDPQLEGRVRQQLSAGDLKGAAEALLRGYGPELYGFLRAGFREAQDVDDAFAMTCENVWRGLAGFRGEASLRTWSYSLARHAASRLRRGEGRRRKRVTDGGTTAAEQIAWQVRTSTNAFRRTDVKDRLRELREQLSDDERELLLLRIDRQLDWREIARVCSDEELDDAALDKQAAVQRKRFERTKDRLRVLAAKAGLISTP